MPRTFPISTVTPAPPSFDLELTIPGNAPPPTETVTVDGCACTDLSVAWFNGSKFATVLVGDPIPPAFAVSGVICSGATYDFVTAWTPTAGGAAPTLTEFGASAWAVYPTVPGVFEVDVSTMCAGEDVALGSLFLTVLHGAYGPPPGCDVPTDWTNIQDLFEPCLISPTYPNGGASYFTLDGDLFTVHKSGFPEVPNYDGTSAPVGVYLTFAGLSSLFAGLSMDVRITLTACTISDSTSHGITFDLQIEHDAGDFTSPIVRTVADASTFFTGLGSGDGAGAIGSAAMRIEVRKTP